MSHYDYFDEKVQEGVEALVQSMVNEWQRLNPHEPDLQAEIASWGEEFLQHVQSHVPIRKRAFASNWPGSTGPRLRIMVDIPRYPDKI